MKKSRISKSHKDIEKEVKEARTIAGRKRLKEEIEQDASEWDVVEIDSEDVRVSPYWDHAEDNNYNEEGEIQEDPQANPDYVDTSKPHEVYPKSFMSEKTQRLYKKLNIEEKMKTLTDKEKEVLDMICHGYSQRETAELLNIAQSTVRDILNGAKNKLKN